MSAPTPPPPPQVQQQRGLPPGNIPRGRQLVIILGMAALVLGAAYLTQPMAPRPRPVASAEREIPKQLTEKELQKVASDMREEAARLALARNAKERAATDYHAMNAQVEAEERQGSIRGERSPYDQPHERVDPIEDARKKRAYTSLFASNIALTLRPAESGVAAKVLTKPEAAPPPAAPPVAAAEAEAASGPVKEDSDSLQKHRLFEGTVLESVLTNRLEGQFTGPVNVALTTNVYSHSGADLLIPQGTRILGEAKRVDNLDQTRLAVVFHRMIMPDGYSVNLDQMPGLDQQGASALKDKVNHHYLSTFGTSIALGLLAGFSMWGTQGVYSADGDASDYYRQGVATQLSRDARQILAHKLNRLPEVTIREGNRVRIILTKDLDVPAFDKHPPVSGL